MQNYESEMMLSYIYTIMGYIDPEIERDNTTLNNILDDSGVDNIVELLKVDNSVIKQIAKHYLQFSHQAPAHLDKLLDVA